MFLLTLLLLLLLTLPLSQRSWWWRRLLVSGLGHRLPPARAWRGLREGTVGVGRSGENNRGIVEKGLGLTYNQQVRSTAVRFVALKAGVVGFEHTLIKD